jgi:hypothetical protein
MPCFLNCIKLTADEFILYNAYTVDAKQLQAWMTITNTHVGGRRRPQSDSTYKEITQSFFVLSDVKLLHFGCRSSTCGLRHVPALLGFTVPLFHKIQCSIKVSVSKCH